MVKEFKDSHLFIQAPVHYTYTFSVANLASVFRHYC